MAKTNPVTWKLTAHQYAVESLAKVVQSVIDTVGTTDAEAIAEGLLRTKRIKISHKIKDLGEVATADLVPGDMVVYRGYMNYQKPTVWVVASAYNKADHSGVYQEMIELRSITSTQTREHPVKDSWAKFHRVELD